MFRAARAIRKWRSFRNSSASGGGRRMAGSAPSWRGKLSLQNSQSFDLLSPSDSSELTMQMLFGSLWLSLIVVIRFIVELFRQHVLGSWLSHRLQRLQGVAGGSIGGAKAETPPSLPLSPPPEKTLR